MEPMHTPETAPTPAERAARHWLLLMGVVVVVVTVATGIWFLTSRDDPAVTPVAEPGAAAGVTITVPPESEYDFFEPGPRIRVTEDEGVATGTIEVTANGPAAADDVRVAVQLIVDGGPKGIRLVLDTDLTGAHEIDRFVIGRQRISLSEREWRLRCVEVNPCEQRISYRMEIPNDAIFVDVALDVGGFLNHPEGAPPAGSAADVTFSVPVTDVAAYSATSVGAAASPDMPNLAVVRMTMPAGFDDPSFELLVFARAPGAHLSVRDPIDLRVRAESSDGVLKLSDLATQCAGTESDCVVDLWIIVAVGGTDPAFFWVESRAERLRQPDLVLHSAVPTVLEGEGPAGASITVVLDGAGIGFPNRAVLFPEGFTDDALVSLSLCDPECVVALRFDLMAVALGTALPGETAPVRTNPWRFTGFLVSVDEAMLPGGATLDMALAP